MTSQRSMPRRLWNRLCRPIAREEGQGLTEYLGLVLIIATALSVGVTLLPASPLPTQARNGVRAAVCKFSTDIGCNEYEPLPSDSGERTGEDPREQRRDTTKDDKGSASLWDKLTRAGRGVADFFRGTADGLLYAGKVVLWTGYQNLGIPVGFLAALGESLVDIVKLVLHPVQTGQGIKQLFQDPSGSLQAIWDGIKDPIVADWRDGFYGLAIGRALFAVVSTLVGGKGLNHLGKAGKLSKTGKAGKIAKPEPDQPGKKPAEKKPKVCPRSWPRTGPATYLPVAAGSAPVKYQGAAPEPGDCNNTGKAGLATQVSRLPSSGPYPFVPKKGESLARPKSVTRKNSRFVDRDGNEWQWDPQKREWDVQHPGRSRHHTNVGPDGRITHKEDNFPRKPSR